MLKVTDKDFPPNYFRRVSKRNREGFYEVSGGESRMGGGHQGTAARRVEGRGAKEKRASINRISDDPIYF